MRVDALPAVEGDAARRRASDRAKGFILLGTLALRRGDFALAREMMTKAVAIERELGDPFMLAYALAILATTGAFFGDLVAMRSIVEESTALFRTGGEHWWVVMTLPLLARIASEEGDQAASQRYREEAYRVVARIEHPILLPTFLGLGAEARTRGDLISARFYFQNGVKLAQRVKNKVFEASMQSELVHVDRQAGDLHAARNGYRQMILKWQELGMRAAVANQLECLAFIAQAEDQTVHAARLLGAAESLRELIHIPMADYERLEYEREVTVLRAQMDVAAYTTAWAEGRMLSMEQAIDAARALAG